MNIKKAWLAGFEELLWEHHTCDWPAGNSNPNLAYQLAVAYFDWSIDGEPEESVEDAFKRYLKVT